LESYIKERGHCDIRSSLRKNGVGISEYALVSRKIGDLSKGKVYKVVNLALKRKVKKFTRVEKIFRAICGLPEVKEHTYVGCRRRNNI
jgi:hypothetical protein